MFQWMQANGTMLKDGQVIAHGYSGFGEGQNNPAMQNVHNVGPLPCGQYRIVIITDTEGGEPVEYEGKAPPVMRLIPDEGNEMFGRGGFLIHGDSRSQPGTASHGCIVLAHDLRERIAGMVKAMAGELDDRLQVV